MSDVSFAPERRAPTRAPALRGQRSLPGPRLPSVLLTVVITAALLWASPVAAQEAGSTTLGEGGNVALTLVGAKPPFFVTGAVAVVASDPEAYVRRASLAGDDDQKLLVATVSDGDAMAALSATIRGVERVSEVGETATFWGDVVKQTQALTVDASPTVGFILASYGGRDPAFRSESLAAATGGLQGIDEVFLVARMRGGADLLAMYAIDGVDLASAVNTANAIHDALGASEVEIEVEGLATQATDKAP